MKNKKSRNVWVVSAVIIISILFLFSGAMMMGGGPSTDNSGGSSNGGGSMEGHHGGGAKVSQGSTLQLGDIASDFSLESIDGDTVSLSDYKGKNVVLFFNEGSMCYPSCWNQMKALANDKRFNNENTVTFPIVIDNRNQWDKIVNEKDPEMSKTRILFDTSKQVSTAYGALYMQSSMHKGSFPGHTYIVIGKDGVVKHIMDDPKMGINNEMLASELE